MTMIETEVGDVKIWQTSENEIKIFSPHATIHKIGFALSMSLFLNNGQVTGTPESIDGLRHDWKKNKYRAQISPKLKLKVFAIILKRVENQISNDANFLKQMRKDYLEHSVTLIQSNIENLQQEIGNLKIQEKEKQHELTSLI